MDTETGRCGKKPLKTDLFFSSEEKEIHNNNILFMTISIYIVIVYYI